MIISLIGPGDIKFHFLELLNFSKDNFEKEIEKIAEALAESKVHIELLPDKGISLEIAKLYKTHKIKNLKVIAAYPKSDKTFGIFHLTEYLNLQINSEPLFTDFIDTENWYKHNLTKCLFADAILYLGRSPGTEIEKNGSIYLYNIFKKFKQKPEPSKNFTIFVYTPFLKDKKLTFEEESYIQQFKIPLIYINNSKELKENLFKLSLKLQH